MSRNKTKDRLILSNITEIRAKNNFLWMSILALAIEARPKKAKKLVREITENDRKVSKWLSKL